MLVAILSVLLVLTLVVLALRARVPSRTETDERQVIGWQSGTRFFLILLRLAIGWHLLVEGIYKFEQTSWSSEVYLREATGPLAPTFRWLAGDSVRERLTPGPGGEFPEALARDWQNYLKAFASHYELSEEQRTRADTIMEQCMSCTRHLLTSKSKSVRVPRRYLTFSRELTSLELLEAHDQAERELRRIEDVDIPSHGKDAFARYREVKDDIARMRRELKADVDQHTRDFKTALQDVLTDAQKERGAVPEPVGKPIGDWTRLDWSDTIVKYALVIVGGCLLGGLLTRTACVAGAILLLLFYLPMMPLPGWPDSPRSEGHYLWINKNIIEMLALLVLATTRSGRWVGLDGLLSLLFTKRNPSTDLSSRPLDVAGPRAANGPGEVSAKEKTHGT